MVWLAITVNQEERTPHRSRALITTHTTVQTAVHLGAANAEAPLVAVSTKRPEGSLFAQYYALPLQKCSKA